MIDTTNALISLKPNAEWVLRGGELEWLDTTQTQPTEAEIEAEIIRLQEEYDAQEYARLRQEEYPTIEEVLHAILDNDMDALQAKRALVKAKYPKGI